MKHIHYTNGLGSTVHEPCTIRAQITSISQRTTAVLILSIFEEHVHLLFCLQHTQNILEFTAYTYAAKDEKHWYPEMSYVRWIYCGKKTIFHLQVLVLIKRRNRKTRFLKVKEAYRVLQTSQPHFLSTVMLQPNLDGFLRKPRRCLVYHKTPSVLNTTTC